MNSDLKITLPPIPQDASGWTLWVGGGDTVTHTPRRWYHRAIYRALMYAHDRAEDLWHWCYYKAERFAPERKMEYVEPKLYGFIGRDGVIVKPEGSAEVEAEVKALAFLCNDTERTFKGRENPPKTTP